MERELEVVDDFPLRDRGTIFVVKAPEPMVQLGETVLLRGRRHHVKGLEYFATNPPTYVKNGLQSFLAVPLVEDA